uniref:Separase n=1 Tax=Ascaris lumbricoides TaxID=6252 RepID=A0A0M3I5E6_ASCLU
LPSCGQCFSLIIFAFNGVFGLKVKQFVEGEAQRYSEHAQALLVTIRALRERSELDLIRGESLLSLDHATRLRLISKTYRLLVSMAPLCAEACPLSTPSVPHFGPAVAEVCSSWFRLYLYTILGEGPVSMYIPKGTRLCSLPRVFWASSRLLLTTTAHEPVIVSIDCCLSTLNDTLQTHAVFLQVCSSWFRLYLYTILGEGPVSMYIPKGTRLCSLPRVFWASSRLLLTTTAHEPVIVSIDCCLSTLNDTLQTHAVFLQVCSSWFRLYLYTILGEGPVSMYIPKGTRLCSLPRVFWASSRLLLTTTAHEPVIVSIDCCLSTLNDTLQTHAVFLQEYSSVVDDSEVVNVPFPYEEEVDDVEDCFASHPSVKRLREKLSLDAFCGYIVLLKKRYKESKEVDPSAQSTAMGNNNLVSKDPRKVSSRRTSLLPDESQSDFVILDCVFGIPLFDIDLNKTICRRIKDVALFDSKKFVIFGASSSFILSVTKLIS